MLHPPFEYSRNRRRINRRLGHCIRPCGLRHVMLMCIWCAGAFASVGTRLTGALLLAPFAEPHGFEHIRVIVQLERSAVMETDIRRYAYKGT